MRGMSLVNAGVVILLAGLLLVFFYPGEERQPGPAADVGANVPEASSEGPPAAESGMTANRTADDEVSVPANAAVVPETVSPTPGTAADGTGSSTETPGSTTAAAGPTTDSGKSASRQVEPLQFPAWPKPRLAFVVTGEQLGYFEPCGCTANQLGGMSRRADLFRQMEALGWTVLGLDAGSVSRRSARQAQIKFETMLTAMRELKYVGLGMGPEELRLDPGFLTSQHSTDGPHPLRFLSANLTFYGVADLGTPLPFAIFEQDGVKVGVTSVLGAGRRKEVIPEQSGDGGGSGDIQWSDPVAALRGVIEKFDSESVELRILLSQAPVEESRELARQFPSLDFVVTAPSFGDGLRQPEMIGSVRLLQVGTQGKHAGVIGVYAADSELPFRFELVTLSGQQFQGSTRMAELMKSYQERLKDEEIVLAESPATHLSGASFVGASRCGECHTRAFEIWKQTAHAHAYESLDPANGRTGHERLEGVSRIHDPECLSCHVTGWNPQEYIRFRSGFIHSSMARADEEKGLEQLLSGNQCENCHGPGSRHVELMEAGKTDQASLGVRVTLEQSREKMGCVSCHDGENSPEFSFDKYWEEVKHEGRE